MDAIENVHVLTRESRAILSPLLDREIPVCPSQCLGCGQRDQCLPAGLAIADLARFDGAILTRKRVKDGESIHYAGQPFTALFAIHSGSFKGVLTRADGRGQVTGFHLPGEIIGLDGIASGRYRCDAVALEDSEVCVLPFSHLEKLSCEMPSLQRRLHHVMGSEITRDYGMLILLGALSAEERIASFLLNLSKRYAARGFSATTFNLRMTRADIGSYLGLTLETVSRALSRLKRDGLIALSGRMVDIRDARRLRQTLGDYGQRRKPRDPD